MKQMEYSKARGGIALFLEVTTKVRIGERVNRAPVNVRNSALDAAQLNIAMFAMHANHVYAHVVGIYAI